MPYLGIYNEEEVLPPQVPDGEIVLCPVCEEQMSVVRSHYSDSTFVSRHFRHLGQDKQLGNTNGGDGGCAGESDIHYKMKSIAYARLENDYPDASIEFESELDGRIPDVRLEFPEPTAPYGKGIAVEAQYQNTGKDKAAVTNHYLNRSYSVAWLEPDDFVGRDVDLSGILSLWPHALPDRTGTEGYPDVIRWLWQHKQAPVKREIPIPGEYWASFSKEGEWITIKEKQLKHNGSARISKSQDGNITFSLGKSSYGSGGESLVVQVSPSDSETLKSVARDLERLAFGEQRPPAAECDDSWHTLSTNWFEGSPTVTANLKIELPDPSPRTPSDVVLTLGKKNDEWNSITMKVKPYAAASIRRLGYLLDDVFECEQDMQ